MAKSTSLVQKNLRYFVGDVRDYQRLVEAMRGVDVVIHAAAMKHVPICEYNPNEAVETNINGTLNVARAACDAGVRCVVGVSTDKAVAPVNLYGATKLAAEKLLLASNSMALRTRFVAVRYGNVLGSEGSVLPFWVAQSTSGPLTITDPAMTRFLITMPEAVDLILAAVEHAKPGEVFVPRLRSARVVDMADALLKVLKRPAGTSVTCIRPGEKVHECLIDPADFDRVAVEASRFIISPYSETQKRSGAADYSSSNPDFLMGVDEVASVIEDWWKGYSRG
jgi:UDP-N-acetylglucosamine 4,6-dehydratase